MTTQHTPGPWTTETVKTQVGHAHKISPIRACIYVDGRDFRETDEKTLTAAANARLIAAAPELLAALRELADEGDRIGNALSARGQGATILGMKTHAARAAIAQATRGSK